MRSGARISPWQAAVSMLVLCVSSIQVAHTAETEATRRKRPNVSPVISGTPPTVVSAGQAYYFRARATDADGDRLWFYIRNQPRWAKFDFRSGELRGTPTEAGSFPNIVIAVSDWRSSAALPYFSITVSPTAAKPNQPPSIAGTPTPTVTVGHAYTFQPTASDPEQVKLAFSVQNRPAWASFDTSTGRLAGNPTAAHVGSYGNIVVSVTDGAMQASLAPFGIQVTSAPNAAPVISGSPATRVVAGQAYSFTPTASDADGDRLAFSAATRPSWAAFDSATGRLSGTPTATNVGTTAGIVISASDGKSSAALPAFNIEVTPAPNRTPLIGGTPAPSVVAAQAYSFTPTASDPDGDRLSFAIQSRPAWAAFDASTGRLSGTPTATSVGTTAGIVISASDGKSSAALPAFNIEVTPAPNRTPLIGGTPAPSVVAAQAYSFTPTASDPDGDRLSFAIQSRPAWAAFDASTGRLSGTPNSQQVGTYPAIVLSVTDGKTFAELPAFAIEVTAPPNRAPTITGTPVRTVTAGQAYSFAPGASDPDGDTLTFSIQNRPSWATFSTSSGRLSGTPTSANVGAYSNVVISVSDGKASVALPAFNIDVAAAPNRTPTLSGSPPTTVQAGQPYAFAPVANDADGDTLSFSITNRPAWASFDATTGQLSGTPQASHVGLTQNIVISVSDGRASVSLPAFAIRVDPAAMASVTLSWRAPTSNEDGTPLTDLAGYQVHYGQAAGQYSQSVSLPSPALNSVTIEDLAPATWFFAVKAVNSDGVLSSFSNEASKTLP